MKIIQGESQMKFINNLFANRIKKHYIDCDFCKWLGKMVFDEMILHQDRFDFPLSKNLNDKYVIEKIHDNCSYCKFYFRAANLIQVIHAFWSFDK